MNGRLAPFAVSVLMVAAPAVAHHSTAMFDNQNPATLTGTVKEYLWRNPHSMLVLDVQRVANQKGEVESALAGVWHVELHSTGILLRRGWTKDFFKPGDTVTVTGGRMMDGSRMIRLDRGTKSDGTKFYGDDFSPEATGNNLGAKPSP
jgi:hypothetical protein